MTVYNYQRINALIRLIMNILDNISSEIKTNISDKTIYDTFLKTFKDEENYYKISDKLYQRIMNLKNVSSDTNKIISDHLSAFINRPEQSNKIFISYYFRKILINVYFDSHDTKNEQIISNINHILVEFEIKAQMSDPYDKLESIILKSQNESYDKFVKWFLESYDNDMINQNSLESNHIKNIEPVIIEPVKREPVKIEPVINKKPIINKTKDELNIDNAMIFLSEQLKKPLGKTRSKIVLIDGKFVDLRKEKELEKEKKKQEKQALGIRTVTAAQKKFIAGRQFNKCANKPGAILKGFETYECPLWQRADEHRGCFDQSGYDIDHIIEFSISHDDTNDNLQALCKSCHSMKTKKFAMEKKKIKKSKNPIQIPTEDPLDT